jgi:uncharacterized protein YbaP (TraB family)
MKHLVFAFVFILFLIDESFAQSSVWKISNRDTEIYIGGTIHLLRSQDFPLPKEFDTAYESSSILVFETDISMLETMEFQQNLMAKAIYPGDSTINDVLSKKTLEKLEKECIALGLPFEQMEKVRPSLLILTMAVMHYQKLGINTPGVDRHFYNRGLEDTREFLSLETIDEQINLIVSMGKGYEDDFVLHSLEDLEKVKEELFNLIKSWKEGNSEENIKDLEEMEREYPELYKELLIKRNNSWLPQIESFFETEEIEFVLVGNLHLHGKDGILVYLENEGYTVEQMK